MRNKTFEFSLNLVTEFPECSNKFFVKMEFETATSCIRDKDASTMLVRHR